MLAAHIVWVDDLVGKFAFGLALPICKRGLITLQRHLIGGIGLDGAVTHAIDHVGKSLAVDLNLARGRVERMALRIVHEVLHGNKGVAVALLALHAEHATLLQLGHADLALLRLDLEGRHSIEVARVIGFADLRHIGFQIAQIIGVDIFLRNGDQRRHGTVWCGDSGRAQMHELLRLAAYGEHVVAHPEFFRYLLDNPLVVLRLVQGFHHLEIVDDRLAPMVGKFRHAARTLPGSDDRQHDVGILGRGGEVDVLTNDQIHIALT